MPRFGFVKLSLAVKQEETCPAKFPQTDVMNSDPADELIIVYAGHHDTLQWHCQEKLQMHRPYWKKRRCLSIFGQSDRQANICVRILQRALQAQVSQ